MRKLASIQRITALDPIENADKIEVASVLGWKVVVKKGDFKVNDLVVYSEIDSLIPDIPIFDFIKKITNDTMRIRTIRMRGQTSQGICFPLSILDNFPNAKQDINLYFGDKICISEIGYDITNVIGITKYEDVIPPDLMGKAKGYMPSSIPKSDITRVQTLQERLDRHKGVICYDTEKINGESITFYLENNVFGVCSKEVDFLETEDSAHWKIAREMDIENKLRSMNGNFSIQGEMIGEGIKKNQYKLKGRTVRFYNVFDIDKYKYFNYNDFVSTIAKLNLQTVPILSDNFVLPNNIDELVKLSNGKSKLCDVPREGIVICPLTEMADRGDRVIFKVISPEFLIKYE